MKFDYKIIGTIAALLVALQTIIGIIVKPFLEDYINEQIDLYEEEKNKDKKPSFRTLLAPKMGLEEDEVHIEVGRMYKNEKDFQENIYKELKSIKKEIKYYHPSTILK